MNITRNKIAFTLSTLLLIALQSGCALINEKHHFQSLDKNGKSVNYFRLTVTGNTGLTKARYLAGYYDEKAVDLYFDEYGKGNGANETAVFRQILPAPKNQNPKGTGAQTVTEPSEPSKNAGASSEGSETTKITGLNGTASTGAYVMVLSTNAKQVMDSIGSLIDSEIFADLLGRAVSKEQIETHASAKSANEQFELKLTAVKSELDAGLKNLAAAKDELARFRIVLNLLDSIAYGLGKTEPFNNMTEARQYFATLSSIKN